MKIRPLRPRDYEAADEKMRRLHRQHVAARPDQYQEVEHVYSRDDFEEIVACDLCIALAAEANGKVIGICFAAIHESKTLHGNQGNKIVYLEALYVDEEVRRRGVATALFEETGRRAKELGASRIELMVWEFNQSARAFYESLGMKTQRVILECPLPV